MAGLLVVALVAVTAPASATVLNFVQRLDDGFDGNFGSATAVAVSPDGAHVYTGDRDGGVALFTRDPATGALTFVARYTYPNSDVHCDGYAHLTVSPDGGQVYYTCYDPQSPDPFALIAYTRNASTGVLTALQAFQDVYATGLSSAFDIAVSPDGSRVYVPGHNGRMAILSRDGGTGLLTSLGYVQQPFTRYAGVAISPDSAHVYASTEDVYLDAFTATGGGLSLIASYEDGVGGFDGIDGGVQMAMSADGSHLYVAACYDGSVGVFARNPSTGALGFVQSADLGLGSTGVHEGVAISPDGRYVFASNKNGPGLVAFSRNRSTGVLTLAETKTTAGGEGWIAVSSDGHRVYLVNWFGSLSTYRMSGCGSPVANCRRPTLPLKSSLIVKDDLDHAKDILVWQWTKGEATTFADFGDPTTDTSYALCVYDRSGPGGTAHLLSTGVAPPGGLCRGRPCWKPVGVGLGYNYSDSLRANEGMNKIVLRTGTAGLAKLTAKAGGVQLATPAPPFTGTVTVQLQAENGTCWEADFSTPTMNAVGVYKAKSD